MPTSELNVPLRSKEEALSHEVFNALMWALSYPGETQKTAFANLEAIGLSLLDLETSFYTPDEALKKTLSKTGSKVKPLDQADYLFFSHITEVDLDELKSAKRGSSVYPDNAATIIIHCQFTQGSKLLLSGPGIEHFNTITVSGIPEVFWQTRKQTRAYPLGWDVFLCDGQNIIGVPRTTEVVL